MDGAWYELPDKSKVFRTIIGRCPYLADESIKSFTVAESFVANAAPTNRNARQDDESDGSPPPLCDGCSSGANDSRSVSEPVDSNVHPPPLEVDPDPDRAPELLESSSDAASTESDSDGDAAEK